MKQLLFALMTFFTVNSTAQVYVEKQTRHRFAQMNVGMDLMMHTGGQTSFLDNSGEIISRKIENGFSPRILIGGTHFWGHADFVLAIPVYNKEQIENNQSLSYTSGVETIFKYYPWRIENNKLRPYIGTSIAPFNYSQDDGLREYGDGPSRSLTRLPLLGGITYNTKNHIFSAGVSYNYDSKIDYYIDPLTIAEIETPPLSVSIGYKYMFETTLGAEKSWENGRTQAVTDTLASRGKLDAFFIGVGLSSAWSLGATEYNKEQFPFIPGYDTQLMADYTLGYYFHKPDLDISLNYRGYTSGASAFTTAQAARRRSLGLEIKKYLFDYNGFVPFLGPVISYENLVFAEQIEDNPRQRWDDNQLGYGLTFGWDIRPNRLQGFLLRTNLRYFPSLKIENVNGSTVNFDNIEFNFIQLVLFPERLF